jgi:hypothetical protein
MHNYAAAQESDFGYFLPSAWVVDHDRITLNNGRETDDVWNRV